MNESKGFFLLLIAVVTVLTLALVWPFIQYVLIAFLLAYILTPLHERLRKIIGPTLSALVVVIGSVVAIIIPFVTMIALIAEDAMGFVAGLEDTEINVVEIEETIETQTGMEVDLLAVARDGVESLMQALLGGATDIVGALTTALIGIGLAGFLLFFLLKDGDKLIAWTRDITPLPETVQDDLYAGLDRITWAVLVGHVAVAVIQGVLAGLGLLVTGVPNVVFWTFVMVILALIPLIGSFAVWAPASVWLFFTGSPVAAAGLFVYGAIVVGLSDEFLRPLIVGRVDISPSLIIVGVIGGLYLLGFMGLFFGPVIVGAFKVILETYDEHFQDLKGL